MMESNNPTPQVPAEPVEEEDPLLELARIVSGDDLGSKTEPPILPVPSENNPIQATPADDAGTTEPVAAGGALDEELAAALMDDLAVEATADSEPTMVQPPVAELLPDPVQTDPVQPDPVQPLPPVSVPAEPTVEPIASAADTDTVAMPGSNELRLDEFESSLEQQLLDEIDAETSIPEPYLPQHTGLEVPQILASEAVPEPSFAIEEAPLPNPPKIEQQLDEPVATVPPLEPQNLGGDPVGFLEEAASAAQSDESVTEEDLGKIFAAEFEQINAEHAGVDNAPDLANEFEQIQAQATPSTGEMAFLGNDSPNDAQPGSSEMAGLEEELGAGMGALLNEDNGLNDLEDMDADFASAFDDELAQNEILPATQIGDHGWDEQASQDAELEFAAAVPGAAVAATVPAPEVLQEPEHLTDPALLDEPVAAAVASDNVENSNSGSGIKMAAIALGIALFAGLGAVSYGYISGDPGPSGPIVVKADQEPVKVKPVDPGGRKVANQDKASYKEVAGDSEGTEQASLVSNKEIARVIAPKTQEIELNNKLGERLEQVGEEPTSSAKPSMTPRKVRTFTVKPDGTIIAPEPLDETASITGVEPVETGTDIQNLALQSTDGTEATRSLDPFKTDNSAVETQPESVTEDAGLAEPVEEVAVVEPASSENDPGRIDGAITTGALAIPSRSPLPKPVAVVAPAPEKPKQAPEASQEEPVQIANLNNQQASQSAPSTAWVVQISSQKSQEAAASSLKNLQRRFPSLLNGRQANIKEAKITGKGTFYRVRVNTQSRDDAGKFCTRFKSAGGSCFVTR